MSLFDAARYRLRTFFRPDTADHERDEEFAFHQTLAEANNAHALRNTTHLKETMRWMGATRWMDQFGQDLRFATRGLRRAPMYTAIVAFTLAIGIGANATVLGVIDTLYLRKLPVPEPERIVRIRQLGRWGNQRTATPLTWTVSPALYRELRTRIERVDGLAAYGMQSFRADGEWTWSAFVSGNYFAVLGVTPQRGRFIRADEEELGADHSIVVISDYLWRTKFKSDETILGRKIPIGTREFTIVGIAPPGFTGLHPEGRTNLWLPYPMVAVAMGKAIPGVDGPSMQMFARLRAGSSASELEGTANSTVRELARTGRADSTHSLKTIVQDRLVPFEPAARWGFSWMVFAWIVVALLHLVACSNVASLMLARAVARRRELGVRLCLGASRRRILMQSLTEASLLAAIGAAAGIVVWRWVTTLVTSMQFLSTGGAAFDWRIVGIVAFVSALSVLQFGLIPSIDASRSDPMSVLRGFSVARRGRHSRSEIVVVVQVAISTMLIANAAVFAMLWRRQVSEPPGFDADHVLVASLVARDARSIAAVRAAYDEAMARVAAVPGIRAATVSLGAPLFKATTTTSITSPGRSVAPTEQVQFPIAAVGPGYFTTIGASLVQGREFTLDDKLHPDAGRQLFVSVIVINEALSKQLWPSGGALGKQLKVYDSSIPSTIVGIVRDIRDVTASSSTPRAYVPLLMWAYPPSFEIVARIDDAAESATDNVTAALSGSTLVDRPVVRTMSAIRHDATSTSRTGSSILAACGGVALLLTCVGLYGLVSMWATRRRGEIGVRLALGATTTHVHRLLLSDAARIIGTGTIIGLALAYGLVQIERGSLGRLISLGVVEIASSLGAFTVVGGLAALIPSLRATRQTPAEVLRSAS
jgi:predicted permease